MRNSINRTFCQALLSKSMKRRTAEGGGSKTKKSKSNAASGVIRGGRRRRRWRHQSWLQQQQSAYVSECVRVCVCVCVGEVRYQQQASCFYLCAICVCSHRHTHTCTEQNACYFTFNTSRGACTKNRLVDKPTRKPTAHFGAKRERERLSVCLYVPVCVCMRVGGRKVSGN